MAFKKTIWSDKFEANLYAKKPLIQIVNQDFEGEVKMGETVKVYTYGQAVTVSDYDGVTPVAAQKMAPDSVSLLIDQAKTFRLRTDRVDELQGDPNAIDKFLTSAVDSVGNVIENYIYALKASLTNDLDKTGTVMTAANAISIIEEAEVALDDENVSEDRFMYVTNSIYSMLRQANYLNVTPAVDDGNGGTKNVYKMGNFEIVKSTNIKDNGTIVEILFGSKDCINFVGALEEIEYGKVEGLFGKAVFGLFVYGAAVFNGKKGGTLTLSV